MRAKSLFLLLLALGCGLVASIGITQAMKSNTDAPPAAETQAIFVAIKDIPTGDLITADLIALEEWPVDNVPEGAITQLEEIEGKRPKSRIFAGTPVQQRQLGGYSGATQSIPEGFRVVPVKVDSVSGGSNMIHPGDRVDVSVNLQRCPAKNIPRTETRLILQDIKVFAVNDTWEMDPEDGEEKLQAQTISLLVTPKQAQMVILASDLGKIRLVMRSPGNDAQADVAEVTVEELLGQTETSDREADSPSGGPTQPVQGSGPDGFLQFLAQQQNQQPPQAVPGVFPSAERQIWTMRSIHGSDVAEVVLQMEEPGAAADVSASSNFSLWKMMKTAAQSGADAAKKLTEKDGRPAADGNNSDTDNDDSQDGASQDEEPNKGNEQPKEDAPQDDGFDDDLARWN